ncbi:unnamed protein product [Callosobruchus maculatus]|uniref:Uncharacterized protein n=1 Tax=Callosobruchus maculatus TaxID=64391 RepID=A0A653BSU4_CALMS|nr:unnamed protein product [Callosobruchus maculatus]
MVKMSAYRRLVGSGASRFCKVSYILLVPGFVLGLQKLFL